MESAKGKPRIVFFDIEATDLEASFGHTLCFGWKQLGWKHTKVISIQDYPAKKSDPEPDYRLMKEVHRILTNEADIIVSFYGKEYDRKFLNTRMLLADLEPLPPLSGEHVDLYFTVRGNLKLHSNRLQAVSETLGCPMSKTAVRADLWRKAQRGDDQALRYVIKHNQLDVDILEWCYLKLRAFVRQHPWVGGKGSCRVCGQSEFQRRGYTVSTNGMRKARLQCQKCGTWSTSTI